MKDHHQDAVMKVLSSTVERTELSEETSI